VHVPKIWAVTSYLALHENKQATGVFHAKAFYQKPDPKDKSGAFYIPQASSSLNSTSVSYSAHTNPP
jgi:hypothetical protein